MHGQNRKLAKVQATIECAIKGLIIFKVLSIRQSLFQTHRGRPHLTEEALYLFNIIGFRSSFQLFPRNVLLLEGLRLT